MSSVRPNLKVALVTMAPFPGGNVSTLRFSSYMKALLKQGCSSYVLIYCPTSMAASQEERCGVHEGIRFQYATKTTWTYGNIIEKIIFLLIGLTKSVWYLHRFRPDSLILYGDNAAFVVLFYSLVARVLGSKFVGDRSELPTIRQRESYYRLKLYEAKQRLYDGMIIMTKQLCDYYSRFSSNKNFVFFMPMTIDVNRFSNIRAIKEPFVATVFGTHNRDGLAETIRAYIYYVRKLNGIYNLMLIGNYDKMPNKDELDTILDNSGIKDKIIIKGPVPISNVPLLLASASCLITTPKVYVSGGFPTKLGEYMLSGTPIVATIAGEMLDYIEPGKDMLMCEPDNISKIADNIKFIENHPKEALLLASNAKKKASSFFNANTYVKELIPWLKCKQITNQH